jgi:hypothetical protein
VAEMSEEKRAEIVEYARKSIADTAADAQRVIATIAYSVESATGVRLPTGPPSVMDATKDELLDAEFRAQHALRALELIRGWFWPNDVPTLGEFVRGLPDDVREQIAEHLVAAGLS